MDGERRATNDSDHEKLVQALNMVIGIAMGERLDSIRQATKELDSRLSTGIESVKKETTESMDKLQHSVLTQTAEMIGRLSKVEEDQQRVLNDLEELRSNELEKQLQICVLAVKNELEKDVSGLRRELADLRGELNQQVQATERVSAFLNSMANVFSVTPPEMQGQQATPSASDPSPFVAASQLTREEVDSAVERALGEEWAPGKTVEMPNPLFRGKKG